MTSTSTAPVAQPPVVGDNGNADPSNPPTPENVPYPKFRELLDETKKEREAKRALEAKISEFEKEKRDKEEADARKRGDFEKIIAAREAENAKLKQDHDSLKQQQDHLKKLSQFVKAAGADIDQKWFNMVDLSSIALDPNTGEVDQMTVAQTVDNFKKTWPEAFKPSGMQIPTAAPNGSPTIPGKIKYADYCNLPLDQMKKYKAADIER